LSYQFRCNELGYIRSGTIEAGETPLSPVDPERIGYNFVGWSPLVDTVTQNIVFLARWESTVAPMVMYEFRCIVLDELFLRGTVELGELPTIPSDPSRAGYNFLGWTPEVGAITQNTIFVAQWSRIPTVTYEFRCNVMGVVFGSGTVLSGGTPSLPSNPSRSGYNFLGWNPIVGPITQNTIYVARWRVILGDGDSGSDPGDTGTQPPVTQPPGAGGGQPPTGQPPATTQPPNQPDPLPTPDPDLLPDIEDMLEEFHARFMLGDDMGNFRPGDGLTRAEAAALLVRTMLGESALVTSHTGIVRFSDVSAGSWYFDYVSLAYIHGLIQGFPDGSFRPNQSITRQEFAIMMARTTTVLRGGILSYTDASYVSYWSYDYVYTMLRLGWMHGDVEGTFRPQEDISRAEAAALLSRALGRGDTTAVSIAGVPNVRIFPDVSDRTAWYFFYVVEASNSHYFIMDGATEIWTRVNNSVNDFR